MLWGDKDNMIPDFQGLVKPGYADCVLAMNECVFDLSEYT